MKTAIVAASATIIVQAMVTGCCSQDPIYDGISRTSDAHDKLDERMWKPIRRFPANQDERQCTVFGTNEWMRVDHYPDGAPCRTIRGSVALDGSPSNITNSETEYDFFGNVISRYSLNFVTDWSTGKTEGITQPNFAKSRYWRSYRRVCHVASRLTGEYSFDMYYYQESESCLKVGVWVLDRGKRSMDRLVLDVKLENGCAVPNVNVFSHLGAITKFEQIAVKLNGVIHIKFKADVGGKVRELDGQINPV